jgi:hypothetical protein
LEASLAALKLDDLGHIDLSLLGTSRLAEEHRKGFKALADGVTSRAGALAASALLAVYLGQHQGALEADPRLCSSFCHALSRTLDGLLVHPEMTPALYRDLADFVLGRLHAFIVRNEAALPPSDAPTSL